MSSTDTDAPRAVVPAGIAHHVEVLARRGFLAVRFHPEDPNAISIDQAARDNNIRPVPDPKVQFRAILGANLPDSATIKPDVPPAMAVPAPAPELEPAALPEPAGEPGEIGLEHLTLAVVEALEHLVVEAHRRGRIGGESDAIGLLARFEREAATATRDDADSAHANALRGKAAGARDMLALMAGKLPFRG